MSSLSYLFHLKNFHSSSSELVFVIILLACPDDFYLIWWYTYVFLIPPALHVYLHSTDLIYLVIRGHASHSPAFHPKTSSTLLIFSVIDFVELLVVYPPRLTSDDKENTYNSHPRDFTKDWFSALLLICCLSCQGWEIFFSKMTCHHSFVLVLCEEIDWFFCCKFDVFFPPDFVSICIASHLILALQCVTRPLKMRLKRSDGKCAGSLSVPPNAVYGYEVSPRFRCCFSSLCTKHNVMVLGSTSEELQAVVLLVTRMSVCQ